jgi:hypothetical protein
VHIGFTILQYAKLRMLMFYYDFMDRYVVLFINSDSDCSLLMSVLLRLNIFFLKEQSVCFSFVDLLIGKTLSI